MEHVRTFHFYHCGNAHEFEVSISDCDEDSPCVVFHGSRETYGGRLSKEQSSVAMPVTMIPKLIDILRRAEGEAAATTGT